ncbi:DUF2637 domain-containing protein [Streptomyces thermolilacinus]|uniref:DUF2637 domain-containing protein n=1 Tax=Streptomyces thermolilacinus SPC6 TaxID=1306406 RepID=A0A1D3DRM2_9ACTN|nr:DUF2637 domain-containing protein [Streptomyces thermolilacinus]OEJ94979.1 hypothetical protein J116_011260 [Streptomyces thermolilacinus SPC6]
MAAMQLTRTHRVLIGVVVAGALVIAGIGFAGSYAAVRELAEKKGFGDFSLVFPIGIDAGICVLLALDLLLTWLRIPFPLLRQTAWLLTAATIAFNGAAAWPDPLGVGMHAVIPMLFVVAVEAARHAVGRIADITADKHMEGVRLTRWLLSPVPTFRLWRRMKLWELRSYDQVIKLEQDRLIYQARLQARFGRAWRRKAPVEALMPLRLAKYGVPLAETAPAGLAAAGIEPVLLPPNPVAQEAPAALATAEAPAPLAAAPVAELPQAATPQPAEHEQAAPHQAQPHALVKTQPEAQPQPEPPAQSHAQVQPHAQAQPPTQQQPQLQAQAQAQPPVPAQATSPAEASVQGQVGPQATAPEQHQQAHPYLQPHPAQARHAEAPEPARVAAPEPSHQRPAPERQAPQTKPAPEPAHPEPASHVSPWFAAPKPPHETAQAGPYGPATHAEQPRTEQLPAEPPSVEGRPYADTSAEVLPEVNDAEYLHAAYEAFQAYVDEHGAEPTADALVHHLANAYGLRHSRAIPMLRRVLTNFRTRYDAELKENHIA